MPALVCTCSFQQPAIVKHYNKYSRIIIHYKINKVMVTGDICMMNNINYFVHTSLLCSCKQPEIYGIQ